MDTFTHHRTVVKTTLDNRDRSLTIDTPCQVLNEFIFKISQEEPTAEKQWRMMELAVSNDEWERVRDFLKVLKVRSIIESLQDRFADIPCHPSMLTLRNRLSPQRPTLPFPMPSLHSSASTRHGPP